MTHRSKALSVVVLLGAVALAACGGGGGGGGTSPAAPIKLFAAYESAHGYELWRTDGTTAGTTMVRDINPGVPDSSPQSIVSLNGVWLFLADDGVNGLELWKSDGTAAGTQMVANINPGAGASSFPYALTVLNNALYFAADDGTHGYELWKSDGTAAGTAMVTDINADAGAGGAGTASSNLQSLAVFNGALYMSACSSAFGLAAVPVNCELWKSDGTAAGTARVADINTQTVIASSDPRNLLAHGGALYFAATDGVNGIELWKSDGSAAGTVLVKDINTTAGSSSSPAILTSVGGHLCFTADDGTNGVELWCSDGTDAGTQLAMDINPNAASSNPRALTVFSPPSAGTPFLYFQADDGVNGPEFWMSVPSVPITTRIEDINPTAGQGSLPDMFFVFNNALYFWADDGTNGVELWTSNGSSDPAGTALFKDINTTAPGAGSFPTPMFELNGAVYFAADDGVNGMELWKTDGTAAGTVLVKDICADVACSGLGF